MEDLPKHYDSCKNFEESLKKYQEAKEKYDAFIKSLPIIVNENNTQEIADQRELLHEELWNAVDEIRWFTEWFMHHYNDLAKAHDFIIEFLWANGEWHKNPEDYR